MIRKEMQIRHAGGLEARPVAVLVQVASQYECTVYLEAGQKRVNAKSIMGMMSLGLNEGETILVETNGSDEAAAMDGIENFIIGNDGK
ncbi:MAG: HPr family phosphocarrier protein [Lachnospiraceae bacterium]|nr:HPr family phosphocarrier protein [Lachnospiraceae bacterium]